MKGQDNIFEHMQGGKGKLPDDKLMAYLEGRLPPEEQHEVERWLADESMESDAIEGLLSVSADDVRHSAMRLNYKLRKATLRKRERRKPFDTSQFTWIAIFIVLLLIVLAFIMIRKSL